jgi:hypothetical protein
MILADRRYGIRADGSYDNSNAIIDMMEDLGGQHALFAGFRMPLPWVQMPFGVIRVTQSGLLAGIDEEGRGGFLMAGHGRGTIYWLDPDGTATDKWVFDNGGTRRVSYCIFKDMVFSGGADWKTADPDTDTGVGYSNIHANVKGFRFTGPGTDDAHVFENVEFRFFEQVAEWTGANNADTTRFGFCDFTKNKHQFLIDNPQSMSAEVVGGSSLNYGTYLKYGAAGLGGGNFTQYGGAIIMLVVEGADVATDRFVVDTSLGGPSGGNLVNKFSGVRVELRGAYGKLAKMTADLASTFKFDTCSLTNTSTANKEVVEIGGSQRLLLHDCQVHDQSTGASRFKITSAARKGQNPHLSFSGECTLPATIHDNIVWNGGYGRLTIGPRCAQSTIGVGQTAVQAIACDILGTKTGNSVSNRTRTRNEVPVPNNDAINSLSEYSVLLPPGVKLHEVYGMWPANAGPATVVRLQIGNNDKSVIYASVTGAFNAGQGVKQVMIPKNVGATTNERTVRFWWDDGAGGAASTGINAAAVPFEGGVVYSG